MPIEQREGYRLWVGGPVPPGSSAITIGSVISIRRGHEQSAYLIRHEKVHVRQWREQGFVGFLVRYVGSYLRWRMRGYGHWAAYRRIPAEIEADWMARRGL
ncbi:MAG: hypothetical protein AB7L13_22305 [Acidimicrobiia bacterium]